MEDNLEILGAEEKEVLQLENKKNKSILDSMYDLPDMESEKTIDLEGVSEEEIRTEIEDFDEIDYVSGKKKEENNGTEKKQAREKEIPERQKQKIALKSAKVYAWTVDLLVSKICAAVSGENADRFKLSENDRRDYTSVSADFFESVEFKLSPQLMFILITIGMFGGSLFNAVKIKKSKESIKKRGFYEENNAHQNLVNVDATPPTITREYGNRRKFDVDNNGFFIYENNNAYIKIEDRTEKAPKFISDAFKTGMKGKEIRELIKTIE